MLGNLYRASWALVVGINRYNEGIPTLNLAEADARAVADMLPSLDFPVENIQLLESSRDDLTRERILSQLDELSHKMDIEDRFLVYWAGHGVASQRFDEVRGYLLLPSSKIVGEWPTPERRHLARAPAHALEMQSFLTGVADLPAKHKLLLIDACFSGFFTRSRSLSTFERGALEKWVSEPVTQILTAGRSGQRAVEDERYGHGAFTYYVLKGLSGQADLRGDGLITFQELAVFVKNRVNDGREGYQDPQDGRFGSGEGEFVFLRAPIPQHARAPEPPRERDLEVVEYRKALRLNPEDEVAHNNLGNALHGKGDLDGAIREYREALRLNRKDEVAHYNLGVALYSKGDLDGAIGEYREALRLNRNYAYAHNNLGVALNDKGDLDEAIGEYGEAIRLNPNYADAHNNLGNVLKAQGDLEGAIGEYRETLRLNRSHAYAHNNLGTALKARGDLDGAIGEYREALRLNRNYADAHNNLGAALKARGDLDGAIEEYREALRLNPNDADTHYNLGAALIAKGDLRASS